MKNNSYTLIISNEVKEQTKFFLVPDTEISSEKRKLLFHVSSMKLDVNLPDDEYDKILNVKASISNSKTEWFPSSVPKEWRACFSKYETDVPVICPNITSVILVN